MRRILTVLIMFFAFGGMLSAEPRKLDKALEKKINAFKKGPSGDDKKSTQDNRKVRVIIQTYGDPQGSGVADHVQKKLGKVLYNFNSFNGILAELDISALEDTAEHPGISRVSM